MIHTGDLTANGSAAQFSVGETFLRHGHYLENGALAGLSLETEFGQLPFDLPGNHDFWNDGSPKTTGAFNSHYGGTYPKCQEINTTAGRVLLYALDSNRSSRWQHRLANGEIEFASLSSLCTMLQAMKGSGAIQVVCLHHPLALKTGTAPTLFGFEILKLSKREAISKLLRNSGADIVLAGHVHDQQQSDQGPEMPVQFIAGSACQISSYPTFWVLDLFPAKVEYTYFQIAPEGIHFSPDSARSGQAAF